MSAYTSGNNAPTLMTQAPNRKGNIGKLTPSHSAGVTAVTRPSGGTDYAPGHQGASAYVRATDNLSAGATAGRKQKVMVQTHCEYDGHIKNGGYLNANPKNYLK
jgi:hypothetical protein